MTPRDMFNQYLVPSRNDCEADPSAVHRAVSALCHIDALAEEVWQALAKPTRQPWQFREALRRRCVELGYAYDIHDIHKHGMLYKHKPVLPNGRRPTVAYIGGAFSAGFSPGFQIGTPVVIITLHDGTTVKALDVVRTSVQWWDTELRALGWP